MSVEHERLAIPMDLELKWAKEILTEQNKHLDKLIAENSKLREGLREDLREDLREEISLRDHFAGLAMQEFIALNNFKASLIVTMSYEMADLMLAERGEKR